MCVFPFPSVSDTAAQYAIVNGPTVTRSLGVNLDKRLARIVAEIFNPVAAVWYRSAFVYLYTFCLVFSFYPPDRTCRHFIDRQPKRERGGGFEENGLFSFNLAFSTRLSGMAGVTRPFISVANSAVISRGRKRASEREEYPDKVHHPSLFLFKTHWGRAQLCAV